MTYETALAIMNLAKHTFTGRDGIMTTIKDIAKHLHISTSTVSRAINGHPEISDKTKKMVMTAVEEANRLGKGAVSLRGKMIDPPIAERARTVLEAAKSMGRRGFDE